MTPERTEAWLKLWHAQIDELGIRAERAGPRASLDYLQRIDDLKLKCALTESRLDSLKTTRP